MRNKHHIRILHLVALIPQNDDLTKKVSHSKSNENVPQPVEDFLSHNIMKIMKQRQEKSDNKLTMKQTEDRTLPLAYEVYKHINAFNYPPYCLKSLINEHAHLGLGDFFSTIHTRKFLAC